MFTFGMFQKTNETIEARDVKVTETFAEEPAKLSLSIESLEPRIAPTGFTLTKQVGWGC